MVRFIIICYYNLFIWGWGRWNSALDLIFYTIILFLFNYTVCELYEVKDHYITLVDEGWTTFILLSNLDIVSCIDILDSERNFHNVF